VIDAEIVEEPFAEVEDEAFPQIVAPSHPFGAGLFSDDEEQQFVRPAAQAEEAPVVESPIAAAEPREIEEPESYAALEDETAAPRKRGRRRTRPWKRLPSAAETEAAELQEPSAAEAEEEIAESGDLLFGGEEETVPEEGEEAAPGEPRKRRRRRRRRTRRDEPSTEPGAGADEDETEEQEEEAFADEEDELFGSGEEPEQAPRERRERRRRPAAPDVEAEHDEDEEEGPEGERPAHRKIPTWDEAVGIVISINMEARAKSSGGRRRR
jgi:ribonuclease E